MKIISAGILVKCGDKYVIGHVTGNDHYDIFKGRQDEGETLAQTAIRECQEESSLVFSESDITYLGTFDYTKKKNLALFIAKIDDVDTNILCCSTFYDEKSEMDGYVSVSFDQVLLLVSNGMRRVLESLKDQITVY